MPTCSFSRDGFLVVACATFLAFAALSVVYTVQASQPYNALEVPASLRSTARTLAPERWEFFTRDPKEPRISSFRLSTEGDWESAELGVNAEPEFLFGLRRISRAHSLEMGQILSAIEDSMWHDCSAPIDTCINAMAAVPVSNKTIHPRLCGDVGFGLRNPIPWAWARRLGHVNMPTKFVRLLIQC